MQRIIGFAPDLAIDTPGIIISVDGPLGPTGFLPTLNGIGAIPRPTLSGMDALSAACRGAAVVRRIDDSRRLIAGTQTKLYEASGTIWSDVSRGGNYVGGAETRWRFAPFGDYQIATNRADAMQVSPGTGAFADLGGTPPKASIIATCQNQVLAFDYNDGVNDYPDGWWSSALGNHASWTPSIATGAVNNRLTDTPGKIRAAKPIGDTMVAYKERSMYLGFQDGPPNWWRWQLVSDEIGCVSQEALCTVPIDGVPAHIFAGFDGFYIFDGSRPRSIGNPLKKWFNDNAEATYRYRIQHEHFRDKQCVAFWLPDSTGVLNFGAVYNYRADKWGYITSSQGVEATLEYMSAGVTYDNFGSLYSTFATNVALPFDSPFWTSGAPQPAVFVNTSLYSHTGTGAVTTFTCSYFGDDERMSTLTRLRLRYNQKPGGPPFCTVYHTRQLGDTPDQTSGSHDGLNATQIDLLASSNWFSPGFSFTGDFEMIGYTAVLEEDGEV